MFIKYPIKLAKTIIQIRLLILLYLLNLSGLLAQQNEIGNNDFFDEARSFTQDTVLVNKLNKLAWDIAPTAADSSIILADSAIKISNKIHYYFGEAQAYDNKGEALRFAGKFEKSIEAHKKARDLFEQVGFSSGVAKSESNIGISYFNLADFSNAFKSFDKALEMYRELDDQDGVSNILGYIGILFTNFNQFEKAIEYYKKSYEISKELGIKSKMAIQLNNIGLTYSDLKEYEKSIEYYRKALEIYRELEDEYNFGLVLGNLGIPYAELQNYSEAKESFLQALEIAKRIGDKYGIAHQYGNLGELYLKIYSSKETFKNITKDNYSINQAIKYLKLSISEFDSLKALEDQKYYLLMLSEAYQKKEDYKNSFFAFKNAQAIKDSIQAKENMKVLAELEIKQELENKEHQISLLNQKNQLQSVIGIGLAILTLFILIIALLIYYYYKKNKEDNILLQKNINMRLEIEKQLRANEKELKEHRNNLEKLVKDRTSKLENEIEERKKTERALIEAIEQAKVASNAKSVFLANMSHELRTPLVGILGYSDLLKTMLDDEETKEMAEGINRTGNRLLNTLSLVLDLARIESDKFEINITEIDICELVKDIYNNFKATAENKNLEFELNLHADSFIQETDLSMMRVIVENLVNNAIKFTREGKVSLLTELVSTEPGETYLKLIVKDTGVGIKKEELSLIFEEFKQLSEGFTKDFQGSGLGLSITQKFVKLLEGEISVKSKFGKGSEFIVSFPVKIKAAA